MKREKWVIRKRFSFMYGSPGLYWRVSHSSLPAYFGHSYHFDRFEDAIEYVCLGVAAEMFFAERKAD